MYRVYHDPEGTELEKNSESTGTKRKESATNFVEEDYKKKIQSLNVEIKDLSDTVRTLTILTSVKQFIL